MFRFFFKYPASTFLKGHFVLLAAWPTWMLWLSIAAAALGLGVLAWARAPRGTDRPAYWRAGAIWLLQSALAALLLVLLWQPAVITTGLKPQQDIIAFLVDDSRSMSIAEDGSTRQKQAVDALQDGVLASVGQKFQTRLYRFDSKLTPVSDLKALQTPIAAPATHIGDSLKQFVDDTADLPIGAVVLLSDGADNSTHVDVETIAALRGRHIPVHAVGFGRETVSHDVEIDDAALTSRAMANSRLGVSVSFHQHGYAGRKSRLILRDGASVLASRDITFQADGAIQSETLLFNVGAAGAKAIEVSLDVQQGEENPANNAVRRVINVEASKRRVLYIEGEPRWDYKFIRRAEQEDTLVQLVSMLRTTENKIYRQSIDDPRELADGFPSKAEDLFVYDAVIIGSVEATYFTPDQRELIREFVDRRGGGLLWLGGRFALADGGWGVSNLADLLPVVLPDAKNTFHVDPANVELAQAGIDSHITRLVDDPAGNADRWKKLPYLMDYQDAGVSKPGAVVLANMSVGRRTLPMLITETYGRGRTAVLATSGTWRWQMNLPVGDTAYTLFWQQLLRWLVTESPGHVAAAVPNQMLLDDGRVALSAEVRGTDYQPVSDGSVEAHIIGPNQTSTTVELSPVPDQPGMFAAEWTAEGPGSYLTEVIAQAGDRTIGRDVLSFQRMDGVVENFHTEQNRQLLERLATQTGGKYWNPRDLSTLADEISLSEAGVTTRETRELWNMPVFLLAIVLLRAAEWLLRRHWGVV
jgi:uncharacterized membrane protein